MGPVGVICMLIGYRQLKREEAAGRPVREWLVCWILARHVKGQPEGLRRISVLLSMHLRRPA